MSKRFAIPIGVIVATLRLQFALPSDMYWPHCAARALLSGVDPYGSACVGLKPDGTFWPTNPLPTALIMLPLSFLSLPFATAIMLGISAALLYRHPLLLFSPPFLLALYYGQWSPLILAVALTPALMPFMLVKPHIGVPALVTRATVRRWVATAAFGLLSLAILPSWPWRWLATVGTYDGFIPILVLPPLALLVLALRNPDARYVLLCACVPQRGVYDTLVVAAALRGRSEMLLWFIASWVVTWVGWSYFSADQINLYSALAGYVPISIVLAMRLYFSRHTLGDVCRRRVAQWATLRCE